MRLPSFRVRVVALLALLILLPSSAWAQPAPPQIEQVRVGLPAGSGDKESGRVRPGSWTPVYLKIKASKAGNPRDAFQVIVQATDPDEALYCYPVSLPALAANQDFVAIAYIRPGKEAGDVKVTLQSKDGKTLQNFPKGVRDTGRETVSPSALLVLSVGARLTNLKNALAQPIKADQPPDPAPPGFPGGIPPGPLPGQPGGPPILPPGLGLLDLPADGREDEGARRFAFIDNVAQMPDQWFGYEAADVIVLATGNQKFVTDLLEDQTGRREALLEWVRRGGRIILSVGSNHQTVARLLQDKLPLLACTIERSLRPKQATALQGWLGNDWPWKEMEIAELQPRDQTHVILREKVGKSEAPLLVQGALGLGRVVLVAFDVDLAPFTEWPEPARRSFWDKLLTAVLDRAPGSYRAEDPVQGNNRELLPDLQRGLETFYDLPVIHFGWVTLFILVYILIVGPLDYFVLKKLFKRLELTWVTFPTLVILVSILAYAVAYRSKGNDVRINQIDLVEYDLHGNQGYGTSWFTLFSPRIARYTLGLEPTAPEWVSKRGADIPYPGTMLATLNATERFQRPGSQGLFPQPYVYAPDATGIEGVPLPVWSTRTFTASWHSPLDPARPAIEADILRSRLGKQQPKGTVTNNLPVALQGITLCYEGRWYSFGDLGPGEERRIEGIFEKNKQWDLRELVEGQEVLQPNLIVPGAGKKGPIDLSLHSSHQLIKTILFHPEITPARKVPGFPGQDLQNFNRPDRDNSGLRSFDQTWRVRPQMEVLGRQTHYRSEIVLVARTQPGGGPAAKMTADGSTPTRLWLGALPGGGAKRPALPGQLWQETYVRAYIPVRNP